MTLINTNKETNMIETKRHTNPTTLVSTLRNVLSIVRNKGIITIIIKKRINYIYKPDPSINSTLY